MRGAYRIRQLLDAGQKRLRLAQAQRMVRKFPVVQSPAAHGLPGQLIVTLTSYPPRFPYLASTLRSLLDQNFKADRVILWIADGDYPHIQNDILDLQKYGLEIAKTADIKSYKKLIPALELWPDAYFVTADDDVYYPPNWLGNLVEVARLHPHDVIAGRVHLARVDERGDLVPYAQWEHATDAVVSSGEDRRLFPTGVGGVLYPPGAFGPLVFDRELFMRLAPRGDDIWFFWLARLNGTNQRRGAGWFEIIEWPRTQSVALYADNMCGDGNDRQIAAMKAHFGQVP